LLVLLFLLLFGVVIIVFLLRLKNWKPFIVGVSI